MKPNLGRILFLWIIAVGQLWGAYQWSVLEAPKILAVGQSGIVRYECRFDSSAAEYSIKLKLNDTPLYKTSILTEQDKVVGGKRIETFDVLITPKTSGTIKINTEAVVRFTGLGAVENTVLGRDNLSKDDIVEEKANLPSITLVANKNMMTLTGKLTLEVRSDTRMVRAHEPLHLSVIVRGAGSLDKMTPYKLNISGVKVFAELPQQSLTPSPQGFEGEVSQEFALVADKSYTIEPLSLSYFDTAKNQIVTLKSKPIYVEVGEGYALSSLLDVPEINDYGTLKRYALYLFFIGLGAGFNEAARWLWKYRPVRKKRTFWESASTLSELVRILSLSGEKRFDEVIRALEEGKMDLREAKKRLRSQEEKQ
ncbi:MAG: hypothetical protein PHQ22_03395 [Sulfuricurvum sp.]|nr:hypothetical protein [Sulfuricurvum sp.]MDD5386218.1 hypothetical protein [Sulfuricurvum sp.]